MARKQLLAVRAQASQAIFQREVKGVPSAWLSATEKIAAHGS
jgi:hypothetical protein